MVREVLIYDLLIKQLVITDNTRELINDLLIKPLVMTDKAFKTCALIQRWRFFLSLSLFLVIVPRDLLKTATSGSAFSDHRGEFPR